jgi:hypothetical protein
MKTRKIAKLLGSLTRQERKNFLIWLEFELGTQDHKTYQFANALRPSATEEQTWAEAFPDKEFDDPEFRKLGTTIQELGEEFLAIKSFRKESELVNLYALKALVSRADKNFFIKAYNKARSRIERLFNRDAQFYEFAWKQDAARVKFHFFNNESEEQAAMYEPLITSYESYVLHSWAEMAVFAQSNAVGLSIDTPREPFMTEYFMANLENYPAFEATPTLKFLRNVYFLHKHATDQIAEVAEEFFQVHDKFSHSSASNLLTSLLNPCFQRFNQSGESKWLITASRLLEFGVEKQYLLTRTNLHPHLYRAMVLIWLHLGKPEVALQKLEQFKPYLAATHAEDHFLYFKAACAIASEDYDEALAIYQNTRFNDQQYKLDAKVFSLFAYYGRQQIEMLPPLIDQRLAQMASFDKLPEAVLSSRQRLLELLKSLSLARNEEDFIRLDAHLEGLSHRDGVRWLKNQAERRKKELSGQKTLESQGKEMVLMLFGSGQKADI